MVPQGFKQEDEVVCGTRAIESRTPTAILSRIASDCAPSRSRVITSTREEEPQSGNCQQRAAPVPPPFRCRCCLCDHKRMVDGMIFEMSRCSYPGSSDTRVSEVSSYELFECCRKTNVQDRDLCVCTCSWDTFHFMCCSCKWVCISNTCMRISQVLSREVTSASRAPPGARVIFASVPRDRACVAPALADARLAI